MSTDDLNESPAPSRKRAVRSDALANREKVLRSAREVFGQLGPEAPIESIARHAGVGSATVYRHFHSRDELFETVMSQRLDAVEGYLDTLGTITDAWAAFVGYTRWLMESPDPRIVLAALTPPTGSRPGMERRRRIRSIVEDLIAQAQAEGALRRPYGIQDHNAFLYAQTRLSAEADVDPGTTERLLEIYLDGLRA